MNHSVYVDSQMPDNQRREALHNGQLFVYSRRETILRFVRFARHMIEDAFAPSILERHSIKCPSNAAHS